MTSFIDTGNVFDKSADGLAKSALRRLRGAWQSGSMDLDIVLDAWSDIVDQRLWLYVPTAEPYGTVDAMLLDVVGVTFDDFVAQLKERVGKLDEQRVDMATRDTRKQETAATVQAHKARGKTQKQTAADMGVSERTVRRHWNTGHETSLDTKRDRSRKVTQVNLSNYTKPATAARKLREKFGAEWCQRLADALNERPTP